MNNISLGISFKYMKAFLENKNTQPSSLALQSQDEDSNLEYDKIQEKFISLQLWATRTNIHCFHCSTTFSSRPCALATASSIDSGNLNFITYGCFCSFACAKAFLISKKK